MLPAMLRKYFIPAVLILISSQIALACHGTLLVSGITEDEKRIILHEHNKLRQLVATGRYPGQPGAQNMREIVWDDELAARAQQWANNCQFRHDPQRTINRFTMGQNLAIIWSTAPLAPNDGDFPSRIQSWFNEVQKYSFGDAWSPATGHYSQLVWGETSLVGCGFAEYRDTTKYNKLYVCNYGPGGNVVGYNPYQVGKPSCASYGLRTSSYYQGLCSGTAAPVSTGITSNSIETYEYTQTNNKQQTPYSSQYPQTAISQSSPSSSSLKQALPVSVLHTESYISGTRTATSSSKNFGNSRTPTPSKYKNKFETYRPSAKEFEKSILKHTILRTHIDNEQKNSDNDEQAQEQQDDQESVDEPETVVDELQTNTQKPIKRGWSLLTWRG